MVNKRVRQIHQESDQSFAQARRVLDNPRLLAGVSSLAALAGMLYALTVTPVYQASVLIQLQPHAAFSEEAPAGMTAATEMEVLRSRSIAAGVVDALRLDIQVEPASPSLMGGDDEHVQVSRFDMPDALLGQPFHLTLGEDGTFTLSREEAGAKVTGRVSEPASVRTSEGAVEILVSRIDARPGARFTIRRVPAFQVAEQLQRALTITESGKLSNVITVSLRGSQPDTTSRILNEIARQYIERQRVERSGDAAQARRALEQQLDESTLRLRGLDARFGQVLRGRGIADVDEEARSLGQEAAALHAALAEQEQRKAELSSRLLDGHPDIVSVTGRLQHLRREARELDGKRRALAAAQHELLRIEREQRIHSDVNAALLNTRRKLVTLTQSSDGQARLLDRAAPPTRPVTLGLPVMMAIACLAGIMCGVVASILYNALAARTRSARGITLAAHKAGGDDGGRAHIRAAEM